MRSAFGGDANNFDRPGDPQCAIHRCFNAPAVGMSVCLTHGSQIYEDYRHALGLVDHALHAATPTQGPLPPPVPCVEVVYYLLIGPNTVKIGTTRQLTDRIRGLRTDMQYVVALELGGQKLERRRHVEFAEERFGRREDFLLSSRLRAHIDWLRPSRDALVATATRPMRESRSDARG